MSSQRRINRAQNSSNQVNTPQLTYAEHIDLTQKEASSDKTRFALGPYIQYLIQLVASILVAIMLIGISTVVGAFTPQAWEVHPSGTRELLDAITANWPSTIILLSALVGAAGSALIFYSQASPYQSNQWLWRLLTALVLVGIFQIIANQMTLEDYTNVILNLPQGILDTLIRQWLAIGTAALVAMLLTFVFRVYGKITNVPHISSSPLLSAWFTLRFLMVSLTMAVIAATFTMYNIGTLTSIVNNNVIWAQWLDQVQEPTHLAALLGCIGTAAVFYYPPKRSDMPRRLGFLRFVLVILTIIGVVSLYSMSINRDIFLAAIRVAVIMTIALLPAQRVYS